MAKDIKFMMPKSIVEVTVNGCKKEISIELNLPTDLRDQVVVGVLLTHGAGGGDLSSGNLPEYAKSFAEAGFPCLRFTCRGPLAHRVAVAKQILQNLKQEPSFPKVPSQWIVAGHSMGARLASQLASDLPNLILACVFFSYPLHPPGEPEKLRDTPLTELALPLLFIRGTKDPFSTEKSWKKVSKRLQSRLVVVKNISGGGHGLEVSSSKGSKDNDAALSGVLDAVKQFCCQVAEKNNPITSKRKQQTRASSSPPISSRKKKKL